MNVETKQLILIADDDADTRDLYCCYLKQEGYRMAAASDGLEVLNKATKLQPDLIVMDLGMPNLNGEDATGILKSNAKTKQIPIVVLTGHASDGSKVVRNNRCDGFLIKPCEPASLLAEIVRVLSMPK
jgi:CheY-like chemotaxis protein